METRTERKERERRKGLFKSNSSVLLTGIVAGSMLAVASNQEVLAKEDEGADALEDKFNVSDTEDLGSQAKEDNAKNLMRDIQQGKEDTYNLLTGADTSFTLPEEFTERVEELAQYEEEEEDDTATVVSIKREQKNLVDLIEGKFNDAKYLGGVVQEVKDGNLGEGTISKSVAVREGDQRLEVLLSEVNALLDVKEVLDEDLQDAKGIQGEIRGIEAEIQEWLKEMLGEDFDLSADGEFSSGDDYLEYLNTVTSGSESYQLRSSFVHQTTNSSRVLASYYGQNGDLDKLIAEGLQYLDRPYVWGGTSLSDGGFDCSGLMVRIFSDSLGINLPRTAATQQNYGTKVDLKDIQPGDLVFWNTPATHVALYLGDGKVMEAANKQAGLRVRDVRLSELSGARRVKDFGIKDGKDTVVHITDSKRTVSYTPQFNREQSERYNENAQRQREQNNRPSNEELSQRAREAERRAKEKLAQEKREKEAQAKKEKEAQAKKEADKKAEEARKQKEKEEAERKAQEEADRKAQEEADKQAQEEADKKAQEEADKKAQEEADKQAQEEADKQAQEDAERKAQEVHEAKAQAEVTSSDEVVETKDSEVNLE